MYLVVHHRVEHMPAFIFGVYTELQRNMYTTPDIIVEHVHALILTLYNVIR
jgi:hypothetical protein